MLIPDRDQRGVIETTGGALLVRAGPGTGKTDLVARKVIHLHQSLSIPLQRILVLTFSRSAAEEMRRKIESFLGKSHGQLCIKTFESIAMEILRDSGPGIGFHLINDFAETFLLMDCIEKVRESLAPEVQTVCGKPGFLREVQETIKSLKRSRISGSQFEKTVGRSRVSSWAEAVGRISAKIEGVQKQKGLFCFEDLLNGAIELLKRDDAARTWFAERFDYAIVDELQDTDSAQMELLQLLAKNSNAVCGLGDPHQAIFTFRGSDPANAGDKFSCLFSSRSIALKTSYRCPQGVLAAAQVLALKDSNGRLDYAYPAAGDGNDDKITVVPLKDSVEEAYFIARKICQMVSESKAKPLQWGDFAIIVRSIVRSGAVLEEALKYHDIPYRSCSDPLFYKSPAVAFLVNYFRWLLEPAPAVLADLLEPVYLGIEAFDVARLRQALESRSGSMLAELLASNTLDQKTKLWNEMGIGADSVAALRRFSQTQSSHRQALQQLVSLSRLAWMVVRDLLGTELMPALGSAEPGRSATTSAQFLRAISSYEEATSLTNGKPGPRPVAGLLRQFMKTHERVLAAFSDEAEMVPSASANNAVQLLTVHHAKGLQFPVVFVAGMADDMFPAPRRKGTLIQEEEWHRLAESLSTPLPTRLGGWSIEQHLAEERRLALVAMTRASRKLILTYPQADSEGAPLNPSLFLDEICEGAAQRIEEPPEPIAGPRPDLDSVYCRKDLEVAVNALLGKTFDATARSRLLDILSAQGIAPAWNRSVPSQPAAKPVPETPRAWAVTDLNAYVRCPRQYFYGRILNLSAPPTAPATFGQAIHRVLAAFRHKHPSLKGAKRDALFEFLISLFDKEWRGAQRADAPSADIRRQRKVYPLELSYDTDMDRRVVYNRAKKMLANYLDFEIKLAENGDQVIHVEKPFEFNFAGRTIKGRIDRIDLMGTGGHRIVDYKTGLTEKSTPPTLKQQFINVKDKEPYVPEDFQVPLYYLACMNIDLRPQPTEFCFYALGREGKKKLDFLACLPIDPSLDSDAKVLTGPELEMAKEHVVAVLERMEAGEYPPRPRESTECQRCAFNFCCEGPNGAEES